MLRGKRGERVLTAKDFQLDMMTTAREADELIVAVRFPVHGKRRGVPRGGAAARRFRHGRGRGVHRRQGQRPARRRRHGGHAGRAAHCARRHQGRRRKARRRSSKATRTCTPRRSCGATSCAISRRSSSRRRNNAPREQGPEGPHRPDAQRPQAVGRDRAAHAAERFPAPFARRDRHPCRLRARRLRLLHRADRRHRGALVPDARHAGRGPRREDRGIARRRRTASSTSCSRRSRTITPCNAASARPAF